VRVADVGTMFDARSEFTPAWPTARSRRPKGRSTFQTECSHGFGQKEEPWPGKTFKAEKLTVQVPVALKDRWARTEPLDANGGPPPFGASRAVVQEAVGLQPMQSVT
jgi:hypothetical protein